MVKASPSNARGAGSILSRGAKIPHALKLKNQNLKKKNKQTKPRSNIVTNSVKTLKIIHIKQKKSVKKERAVKLCGTVKLCGRGCSENLVSNNGIKGSEFTESSCTTCLVFTITL